MQSKTFASIYILMVLGLITRRTCRPTWLHI